MQEPPAGGKPGRSAVSGGLRRTGRLAAHASESPRRPTRSQKAGTRAEGEGFEPSIRLTTDNGFRAANKRPICRDSCSSSPVGSPTRGASPIGCVSGIRTRAIAESCGKRPRRADRRELDGLVGLVFSGGRPHPRALRGPRGIRRPRIRSKAVWLANRRPSSVRPRHDPRAVARRGRSLQSAAKVGVHRAGRLLTCSALRQAWPHALGRERDPGEA